MPGLAVVTGASSGIGEAYAERLAADGWDLVVVARRGDRLGELGSAPDRGSRGDCASDPGRPVPLGGGGARLGGEIGALPVDMLVNNAGLAHYMPFADLPPGQATELVDLNVVAPVLLTLALLRGTLARSRGTVINVASLLAFDQPVPAGFLPKRAVYAGTKSFLVTFSQALAAEVRGRGVKVQVVCPGLVRTEFHSRQDMDVRAPADGAWAARSGKPGGPELTG